MRVTGILVSLAGLLAAVFAWIAHGQALAAATGAMRGNEAYAVSFLNRVVSCFIPGTGAAAASTAACVAAWCIWGLMGLGVVLMVGGVLLATRRGPST